MATTIQSKRLCSSLTTLVSTKDCINSVRTLGKGCRRRRYSTAPAGHPFAFAFDIDGVLIRSSEPIPSARKALLELQARRIPFILLTNGGGKHEQERVSELSKRLQVPLSTDMFVQSHTPFAALPLKHEPVLVAGGEGDKCRRVAESYGFTNVITPSDIYHANPAVWPFSAPFAPYHAAAARPLPLPLYDPTSSWPPKADKHLRIASMFVYNDPRDFALELQIILDVLLSFQGFVGTRSKLNGLEYLPNAGFQQDGQPPLTIANPDLFWAAKWHLPRLGSGAFKAALIGLWHAVTDGKAKLRLTVGGKPSEATFGFAEDRLESHRQTLLGGSDMAGRKVAGDLRRVYMVGDNPASDVLGANSYQSPRSTEWTSILVRSGVFAGEIPPDPSYKPKTIVDDVLDAVNWGLAQEAQETVER